MKITVIGGGKMGQDLIQGFLNLPNIEAQDVFLLSGHPETTQKIATKFGINEIKSLDDIPESNLLINATPVKSSAVILQKIARLVSEKTIIISVAYGLGIEQMQKLTKRNNNLIYLIPNLPVSINQGVLAIDYPKDFDFENSIAKEVLSGLGTVVQVSDELMDVVSAGAGSAPAFVAMMIEALADGLVFHGLSRELAYEITEKMVQGTAAMLLEKDIHPAKLKDQVSSPAGSTIRGVAALEDYQMRNAFIKAISATINSPK